MKGFGCLDTFKSLFFLLKLIDMDKPVSVYFSELWSGTKFICLITYFSNFSMRDFFFFKVISQKQYFILFSAQGNLMTDNTSVSELTCTYSSFKGKNLCQLCEVARTTRGNLRILLLEEQHFSCCCINYITLYLSQFRRKVTIKLWHFSGELPFYLETTWSWGHIIKMKWRPLPRCVINYIR